jgi:hypothetical protein
MRSTEYGVQAANHKFVAETRAPDKCGRLIAWRRQRQAHISKDHRRCPHNPAIRAVNVFKPFNQLCQLQMEGDPLECRRAHSNAVGMPRGFPKCILGKSRDRHPILGIRRNSGFYPMGGQHSKERNTVDEMSSGANCHFGYTLFRDLTAC